MTDVNTPQDNTLPEPGEGGAGVLRPDQRGADRPGEAPAKPSTGGDGSSGAGGSGGFGTGT